MSFLLDLLKFAFDLIELLFFFFFLFSIKTEFATIENQHVKLFNAGIILTSNTFALTSACKMDLHQFPFDAQSCTITLQSPIHTSTSETRKSMIIRVGQN